MLANTHVAASGSGQADASHADGPFRAAFQSARMAIVMADACRAGCPVIFVNEAFLRLTGYSRDEVLGRSFRSLQGDAADQAALARIDHALRSGEALETEILGRRKDGSPFWTSLAMSPVHDDDGNLRHFVMFHRDIGTQRQAEIEQHLEELVDGRTRDLQSALDRKTGQLHEVEHRVKNSLQMIASLVLLKARRAQDPEARKSLSELAERVGALATAHRLLYASGEANGFDLAAFAAELAEELAAALPPGQVALNLDLQPLRVPAARAASLALLLNELVGNAVKHAFPGGRPGQLTIRIGRDEKSVTIAVEDDGVGLHHSPPPKGSFGKTLIAMLVQQLKGQLTWLDGKPGTRAEIVMPLESGEARC